MRVATGPAGPKPGKPSRFKQRPEDIDRALAEEQISRTVRQNRPDACAAGAGASRAQGEPFNAAETFTSPRRSSGARPTRLARAVAPRPTAQMGWNPQHRRLIREVLRMPKKRTSLHSAYTTDVI